MIEGANKCLKPKEQRGEENPERLPFKGSHRKSSLLPA